MDQTKNIIMTSLTDHGYLISQQRRIIIDELCLVKEIQDIEDFWIGLRLKYGISWATVHNTLRVLKTLGLLVSLKENKQNYHKLTLPTAFQNTDRI